MMFNRAECRQLTGDAAKLRLPPPDADGNYPAVETMRAMLRTGSHGGDVPSGFPRSNWPGELESGPKRSTGWNRESIPLAWRQWTSWMATAPRSGELDASER